MENHVLLQVLIGAAALVSGSIGAYVSLQNRALLAEVRTELAALENRLILRINGTYIRRSVVQLQEALIDQRLDQLADELKRRL